MLSPHPFPLVEASWHLGCIVSRGRNLSGGFRGWQADLAR